MPLASLPDWILGFSVCLLKAWHVSVYLKCEYRAVEGAKNMQLVDSCMVQV